MLQCSANSTGSPQFLCWIIPPLVMALVIDRRRWWPVAALALADALLTQLGYPLLYAQLIGAAPIAAGVLTARNLVTVLLLGWAIVRLVRVPRRVRHPVVDLTTN